MMSAAGRIAFVSPRFSEVATVGGAETLLKALALKAAQAGREVTFLTTCATNHFTWANDLPAGETTFEGMRVRRFPVDADRDLEVFLRAQEKISRRVPVTPEEEMDWLRHNVNSRALCSHLEEEGRRYDRIVAGPYLFGLIYFVSLIHPDRTVLVPCLHDEAFAYLKAFNRLFTSVRGFMFNSVPERELARRLYGLDGRSLPVVGMGLDPFDADPGAFARKRGLAAPYVVYSGRREPLKGTPLLLDYLAAFRERTGRDVKLVLTGTGPVEPPASLAPHIIDLGFVSEAEKHEAMAGAVAFCHASVNESFGIVLMESWLSGTPCLVNAAGEVLRWQCESSNGGLWFRNYPEFEEALCLLMDRTDVRKAIGLAGREYVQREYAWDAIAGKMFAALDA